MEAKGKRAGRTAKKVAEAEVDNVEPEMVKNGDAKKKPAPKGAKVTKQKAVEEPVEAEQAPEEKKKSGRKGKATAALEVDPLETAPVVAEEPTKGRKGRKPAVAQEEAPEDEPPVKKGRGRKAAEEVAPVENGNAAAKVPKGKGKGKAAKEEVAEPEPVAVPVKRGRGKAKAETKGTSEVMEGVVGILLTKCIFRTRRRTCTISTQKVETGSSQRAVAEEVQPKESSRSRTRSCE